MSLALLNTVVVLGCSKSLGSLFFLNSDISTPPLAVGLATPKFGGTLIRTLISEIDTLICPHRCASAWFVSGASF